MKAKLFATFLLLFIISDSINSQTYFRLQYKSPDAKDTTTYDAFFCLYNTGNGFVRVSFHSPFCPKNVVVNMDIQEDFAINKDGLTDTSALVYEGMNPKFIFDNRFFCRDTSKIKFTRVTFCFKTNEVNDRIPWGVTAAPANIIPAKRNFIAPDSAYIKPDQLKQDVVKYFFIPKDEFSINFYRPKGKGATALTPKERDSTIMFLTIVASTYDTTLMPKDRSQLSYVLVDARKVIKDFTAIANFLKIQIIVDTVYGDRYSRKSVENAIKKIKPRRSLKDIVIFYYTGHGYNRKIGDKEHDYPNLALWNLSNLYDSAELNNETLNIQDVFDTIKAKGAFLNLVLSDCCNDKPGVKKATVTAPPKPKGEPDKLFDNYKALFLKEPFNLLMTACSKYERSAIHEPNNSLFTDFFLRSLKLYLSSGKSNPGWFQLMQETQVGTILRAKDITCNSQASGKCKQTPKMYFPALKLN